MKKLLLLAVLLSCAVPQVFALAAAYSVAPLIVEHTIAPRDIFEETIKITNTSDGPLRLYPTVNAVTLGSEGDIQAFVPASMGNTATSVTSWIELTRKRVEIGPGETIKIPVSIRVSPSALPGEYHAFIGFPSGENRDVAEAKVLRGTELGTIIRLSLTERRDEYLRLQRFSIPRFVTGDTSAVVQYEIENVGTTPITPTGEIVFYDSTGQERTALPINLEAKVIRPQSTESFSVPLPEVGYIGRHKAFLNIEYGTKERANVYDTVYFNIVPLQTIILLFVLLLTLSGIATLLYHRRIARGGYTEDEESVSVFVRNGVRGPEKDHDINLKQN